MDEFYIVLMGVIGYEIDMIKVALTERRAMRDVLLFPTLKSLS